ncbi:unnamed protein product [Ilex paraguariensis]|uniref:Fe2OG dioxygenase domain-containing protein n=1 Tax=Ilex paraguariensis TaxID=185542 RepID=A0ABC8US97_9AQUA
MAITTITTTTTNPCQHYNRFEEAKKLDESKTRVKGLVDSGLTTIPHILHHPPQNSPNPKPSTRNPKLSLPIVDLSSTRSTVVDQIRHAASTIGFFQIINHDIPKIVMDLMLSSIKSFHELPDTTRMQCYGRDMSHGVAYYTNVDLYKCKEANWRDSLEPELTVGLKWHTDPVGLTVLLVNEVRGLQVKHVEDWIDVKPDPSGLIVNIGDILQEATCDFEETMISNDEYKSVEHRVLANPSREPRVSIPVFFTSRMTENMYGPLSEVVSPEKPAAYRQFTISNFMEKYYSEELRGKSVMNAYKVSNI